MKSVSDCLSFIGSIVLSIREKHIGIGNVEDIRDFMIGVYNDKYIEEMVVMT